MALDVKEGAANHFGILFKLQSLMQPSYPDLEIFKDDVIDALYPGRPTTTDSEKQDAIWNKAADKLVEDWIKREPQEVIEQIELIELEIGQRWPRQMPYLCRALAQKTSEPLAWFDAMLLTALPADTVRPFWHEAILRDQEGWDLALRIAFETDRLRPSAIWDILTCENVPDDLIQAAFNIAGEHPYLMESLVRSNRLSRELVIELFKHPDKSFVSKLTIAEWQRKETGAMADDIRKLWEQAVIEHCEGDYWLLELFKVEAELAVRWFKHRLTDNSYHPAYEFRTGFGKVIAKWSFEHRRNLLDIVPCGYPYNEILVKVIGDNLALYEQLLKKPDCTDSAELAPLHRSIDSTWVSFANLAHAHDHAPEEIVTHTFMAVGIVATWVGKYSDTWKNWRDQFDAIRDHEDEIIRGIAEIGYRSSEERYKEELDKERDEDVYGRDWD